MSEWYKQKAKEKIAMIGIAIDQPQNITQFFENHARELPHLALHRQRQSPTHAITRQQIGRIPLYRGAHAQLLNHLDNRGRIVH